MTIKKGIYCGGRFIITSDIDLPLMLGMHILPAEIFIANLPLITDDNRSPKVSCQ